MRPRRAEQVGKQAVAPPDCEAPPAPSKAHLETVTLTGHADVAVAVAPAPATSAAADGDGRLPIARHIARHWATACVAGARHGRRRDGGMPSPLSDRRVLEPRLATSCQA